MELPDVGSDIGVSLANMADRHEFVQVPNSFYTYASTTNVSRWRTCALTRFSVSDQSLLRVMERS